MRARTCGVSSSLANQHRAKHGLGSICVRWYANRFLAAAALHNQPFAPGTGTPEPGGLSSSQLLTLIEGLAPLNMVGMDCVEVAPAYDHPELTSQVAATCVWTYLCGQIAKLPRTSPDHAA